MRQNDPNAPLPWLGHDALVLARNAHWIVARTWSRHPGLLGALAAIALVQSVVPAGFARTYELHRPQAPLEAAVG